MAGFAILGPTAVLAGPEILVDTNLVAVPVPQGTVGAHSITVENIGDTQLDWTVTDAFSGPFVEMDREFEVTWLATSSTYSYPRTLAYDAQRDVLWVGYYYATQVGKLDPNTGAVLGTYDIDPIRPYALDMEGGDLWAADYYAKNFKRLDPETWTDLQTIDSPATWSYGPAGMARDNGQFYGVQQYKYGIDRLDPDTGAVQASFGQDEVFYYYYNHIDAIGDLVWCSASSNPQNVIRKYDGATGNFLGSVEMDAWRDTSYCYIYDLSFAGTNTVCWMLTCNVYDDAKLYAHRVDLSNIGQYYRSTDGGSISAGDSAALDVSLDSTGLTPGWYQTSLGFASNDPLDPFLEKPLIFVVHTPGANDAPTADAGSDQYIAATGATTPVTLDASGSADPNGDRLAYTWSDDGTTLATGENPTVNLTPGTHTITLTVDDLRGGTDSDTAQITLGSPQIEVENDAPVFVPQGESGVVTVTVRNTGDMMLTWTVETIGDPAWTNHVALSSFDGATGPGETDTFTVTLDSAGLATDLYALTLRFNSNDADAASLDSAIDFLVHTPGENHDPTANAGPDRTEGIPWATAPFIMDLSGTGTGSSDPDGDYLDVSWTLNGQPFEPGQGGLVELGVGAHTFALTVDDLRGGTDTDEMLFTVTSEPYRDWTQWHGSAGTTHAAESGSNWLENWPPTLEWMAYGVRASGYSGNSCPVVSDGRVYYVAGGLKCLDAMTGVLLWNTPFEGGNSVPAVDADRVYVGDKNGGIKNGTCGLFCFDKRTGALLWSVPEVGLGSDADGSGEWCSPAVHGDVVYFGRNALDKYTGDILWSSGPYDYFYKPFNWNGRTLILAAGNFYDPLTGSWVGYAGNRVAVDEGWYQATVTHGADKIWSVTKLEPIGGGTTDWSNTDLEKVTYTQPFTIGDTGYFVDGGHGSGGPVYAVDIGTGANIGKGPTVATIIGVGDKVVGHGGGKVHLISATPTGVVSQEYRFDDGANGYAEPAYANQRLYVPLTDGLACLYFGRRTPVVGHRDGEWNYFTGRATLAGDLVNTGGETTQATIYWGYTDGGTNAGLWEHAATLGERTRGPFSAVLYNVQSDRLIFYRCYAENALGGAWEPGPSRTLSTYAPPLTEGAEDLVLHWSFDEGAGNRVADRSGHGYHGTLDAEFSGTEWTQGVLGGGLAFAGVAQAVRIEKEFDAPLNKEWSLSLWVKFSVDSPGHALYLSEYPIGHPAGDGRYLRLSLTGGCAVFWDNEKNGPFSKPSHPINDGQWHHVVLIRGNDAFTFRVDGQLCQQWNYGEGTYRRLALGEYAWQNGMTDAVVDDVRIYRHALTGEEISALGALPGGNESDAGATASDDAEEASDGTVILDGEILNLGENESGDARIVGLRFPSLAIPQGATIIGATLQLAASETLDQSAALEIRAQDADHATAFTDVAGDLSARPLTDAGVPWAPGEWTAHDQGPAQCSPQIGSLIQEVVDRTGWSSGNAIACLIRGSGRRVVDASENGSGLSAVLSVQWTDTTDLDGDQLPDVYERRTGAPAAVTMCGDCDKDGILNYYEYLAGTDIGDPLDCLGVRLRILPDGKLAAGFNACAVRGDEGYPPGAQRYYSLECLDTLPLDEPSSQDVWVEDFDDLTNGTFIDTGDTAWSAEGKASVNSGELLITERDVMTWQSEPVQLSGHLAYVTFDWKGPANHSSAWTKAYLCDEMGNRTLIFERTGTSAAWETVQVEGIRAWTLTLEIISYDADPWSNKCYLDNVKIQRKAAPAWNPVPGMQNITVPSDRTVEYTNTVPNACGFYRLKVKVE